MSFDPIRGRLGNHRFHMMLVHFPSALYPFSLVMGILYPVTGEATFDAASLYGLEGALTMSTVAILYGVIDFVRIDTQSPAWRTAGIHAILNVCWFFIFACLLFYRIKHEDASLNWVYPGAMAIPTLGLFISNYFGAELVIRFGIGIGKNEK